jgi:hypothetical protein
LAEEVIQMCISGLSDKLTRMFLPVAILTGFAIFGLLASKSSSLQAQVGPQQIPDLRGTWGGEASEVRFRDSRDPTAEPQFGSGGLVIFTITHQQEGLFAGTIPDPDNPGNKVTGVVLPDGAVSIQIQEGQGEGNDRYFITAALTVADGRYRMTGYGHVFEELSQASRPRMGSIQFYADKVN